MTRVLSIVYQRDAGAGVFAEAIEDAGARLETWLPAEEDGPPVDPFEYQAVLAFGGAMHVDQEHQHPWLAAQRTLLAKLLERQVPLLGVCLGAQLLAAAAGAAVERAPVAEIGWYPLRTTPQAITDPLLGPLAPEFDALEWHSYSFALPPGATPLARSDTCLQAYRVGETAWGIQFHAEVTQPDLDAWIADYRSDPDALSLDAERFRTESRPRMEPWNQLGRELCQRFVAVARGVSGG